MPSSDDSDEDISHLREAVDPAFLSDIMFDENKAANAHTSHGCGVGQLCELKQSLRKCGEEWELNDLRVTPQFQAFVAKHLADVVDKSLKEVKKQTCSTDESIDETAGGIKLFSLSSSVLKHSREEPQASKPAARSTASKRRKHSGKESSSEEDCEVPMEDLASVAVSPEWVLTQQGTKGWSIPTRGEVITVEASTVNGSGKDSCPNPLQLSADSNTVVDNNDQTKLKKKEKKRKQQTLSACSEKGSNIDTVQCATEDGVADVNGKTQKKKKKKRKHEKLTTSVEKTSDSIPELSANGGESTDLESKRLKKSEKRKRQRLKRKHLQQSNGQSN